MDLPMLLGPKNILAGRRGLTRTLDIIMVSGQVRQVAEQAEARSSISSARAGLADVTISCTSLVSATSSCR